MKRYIGYTILIILVIISFLFFYKAKQAHFSKASSSNEVVTTKSDWDSGTKQNIDTTSSEGSMKIDTTGEAQIDLTALYDSGELTASATVNNDQAGNIVDGDMGTSWHFGWGLEPCEPTTPSCKTESVTIDLGDEYTVSRIHLNNTSAPIEPYMVDGGTPICDLGLVDGECILSPPITFQTISFGRASGWDETYDFSIQELEMYSTSLGVHITSAIDGGANFWQWNSNSITQTVPANTTATYKYRTKADNTDWTEWVDELGSVTNRTGDDDNNPTRYRYLQVKATLSNTDGVSTPQIDQYDIDYHTEVKPNAPSAQTATVQ